MRHNVNITRLLVIFLLTMTASLPTQAEDEKIQSFTIRSGSLESIPTPGRGYTFRATSGEVETFDMSGEAFLRNKGGSAPGVPGLREIGFKLVGDIDYLYMTSSGPRSEAAAMQVAAAEHPGVKIVARLFQGEANTRLEISVSGQTPVFRTDLKIGDRDVTLWMQRKAGDK